MAQTFEIRKSFIKLGAAVKDGVRDGDEKTVKPISEMSTRRGATFIRFLLYS